MSRRASRSFVNKSGFAASLCRRCSHCCFRHVGRRIGAPGAFNMSVSRHYRSATKNVTRPRQLSVASRHCRRWHGRVNFAWPTGIVDWDAVASTLCCRPTMSIVARPCQLCAEDRHGRLGRARANFALPTRNVDCDATTSVVSRRAALPKVTHRGPAASAIVDAHRISMHT